MYKKLKVLGACDGALRWVGRRRSIQKAWDECPNVHWMVWILQKFEVDLKPMFIELGRECLGMSGMEFERWISRGVKPKGRPWKEDYIYWMDDLIFHCIDKAKAVKILRKHFPCITAIALNF